jgi:hypothetical protein
VAGDDPPSLRHGGGLDGDGVTGVFEPRSAKHRCDVKTWWGCAPACRVVFAASRDCLRSNGFNSAT